MSGPSGPGGPPVPKQGQGSPGKPPRPPTKSPSPEQNRRVTLQHTLFLDRAAALIPRETSVLRIAFLNRGGTDDRPVDVRTALEVAAQATKLDVNLNQAARFAAMIAPANGMDIVTYKRLVASLTEWEKMQDGLRNGKYVLADILKKHGKLLDQDFLNSMLAADVEHLSSIQLVLPPTRIWKKPRISKQATPHTVAAIRSLLPSASPHESLILSFYLMDQLEIDTEFGTYALAALEQLLLRVGAAAGASPSPPSGSRSAAPSKERPTEAKARNEISQPTLTSAASEPEASQKTPTKLAEALQRSLLMLMQLKTLLPEEQLSTDMPALADSVRLLASVPGESEETLSGSIMSMHVWRIAYELESKYQQANSSIQEMVEETSRQKGTIAKLEQSNKELRQQNWGLERNVSETHTILKEMKAEHESTSNKLLEAKRAGAANEAELAQLAESNRELSDALSVLNVEKAGLEMRVKKQQNSVEAGEMEMTSVRTKLESAWLQLEKRDHTMKDMKEQLHQTLEALKDRMAQLEAATDRVQEVEAQNRDLESSLVDLRVDNDRLEALSMEAELSISSLESQRQLLSTQLVAAKNDLERINKQVTEAKLQVGNREHTLEAVSSQLHHSLALLDERKKQLEAATAEHKRLQYSNEQLSSSENYKARCMELQAKLTRMEIRLRESEMQVFALRTQLSKSAKEEKGDEKHALEKANLEVARLTQQNKVMLRYYKDMAGRDPENAPFSLEWLDTSEAENQAILDKVARLQESEFILGKVTFQNKVLSQELLEARTREKEAVMEASRLEAEMKAARAERDHWIVELELEQALQPVVVLDSEGKVVLWNAKAVQATGFLREDVVGTPLGTYAFREAARDELKEMMRKTLKGGGDQHMAMRLDCKYQNHDVLWHIILTDRGAVAENFAGQTGRIMVNVISSELLEKTGQTRARGALSTKNPTTSSSSSTTGVFRSGAPASHTSDPGKQRGDSGGPHYTFPDEVDVAVNKAIERGELGPSVRRVERGVYNIGGVRRILKMQDGALMVRVGGGFTPIMEFMELGRGMTAAELAPQEDSRTKKPSKKGPTKKPLSPYNIGARSSSPSNRDSDLSTEKGRAQMLDALWRSSTLTTAGGAPRQLLRDGEWNPPAPKKIVQRSKPTVSEIRKGFWVTQPKKPKPTQTTARPSSAPTTHRGDTSHRNSRPNTARGSVLANAAAVTQPNTPSTSSPASRGAELSLQARQAILVSSTTDVSSTDDNPQTQHPSPPRQLETMESRETIDSVSTDKLADDLGKWVVQTVFTSDSPE